MKIYVVDDHESNIEVCKLMLSDLEAEISTFTSGMNVIAALQEVEVLPDVIVLDVMMPELNGFHTAQIIRDSFPDRHIAIIFLTALTDQDSFGKCLSYGDDFISKPVQRNVLVAKVCAHYRIAKMHNEVAAQKAELHQFREQVKYDYSIAEQIFAHLKEAAFDQLDNLQGVKSLSSPSSLFNGDVMVLAPRPHGGIYGMIADATGHGLPAAISSIPATRAFFSMAAKGMPLGDIVFEINSVLNRFLPAGMMLAATVFEVSANGVDVSLWKGGLPDGYVVAKTGEVTEHLRSQHMPLGVLTEREFDATIERICLTEGQTLMFYTDGLTEATNSLGEQFGEARLLSVLQRHPDDVIDALNLAVNRFSKKVNDDLSILTLTAPIRVLSPPSINSPLVAHQGAGFAVKTRLQLDAIAIASTSMMAELRQVLKGFIHGGSHIDLICSVLSELLANAIDHGLLALDSSIKDESDGFLHYYQIREAKLRQLSSQAWIKIALNYAPSDRHLLISVEHNGIGFNGHKNANISEEHTHGRGLTLIHALCKEVSYTNQGRCVHVNYQW